MASLDIGELVNIGGVEFLLALYEKHPRSELYLNTIGKCLCLLSLDAKRHHLFVVSGWLKRLHHMLHSASADTNAATADADADANAGDSRDAILSHTENNINFVRETIAHKILFNLTTLSRWAVKNQSGDESSQATTPQPPPPPPPPPVYSTMLYPLWPYSGDEHEAAVTTMSSHHAHEFDVIFVHGLRGSLFRTWRQEDQLEIFDVDDDESEREKGGNATDEADDDEERNRTTRCWARDWLPLDVEEHMTLDNDDEENATAATAYKLRVLGVDYDSLYSLWGQELVDEKKLNLSIKKQAAQLADQLRLAKVCLFFALFCSFCLNLYLQQQRKIGRRSTDDLDLSLDGRPHCQAASRRLGGSEKQQQQSEWRRPCGQLQCDCLPQHATSRLGLGSQRRQILLRSLSLHRNHRAGRQQHVSSRPQQTVRKPFAKTQIKKLTLFFLLNELLLLLSFYECCRFLKLIDNGRLNQMRILSLCETLPTYIYANWYAQTVSQQSANLGVGDFHLVHYKDHTNICKPHDRTCDVYKACVRLVVERIQCQLATCDVCRQANKRYAAAQRPLAAYFNRRLFESLNLIES